MKKTKFLLAVLTLLLCVSMVLAGCRKTDDEPPEVTLSEDEQKDAVVEAFNQSDTMNLSGLNARETLEQILGTNVLQLTYKIPNIAEGTLAYKDGYVYVDAGEKMWLYINRTDAALFERSTSTNQWEGKIVSLVGNRENSVSVTGDSSALSGVKLPQKLTLPELKTSDLTFEGDRVVLSNDYIKAVFKQPEMYEAITGTKTPADDVKASTDGVIDAVVDAFRLEVSFRFSGTSIGKISVAADLDTSGLSWKLKSSLPKALKGSIDFNLNNKADTVTGMKVDLELGLDESTAKVNAQIKVIRKEDVVKGLNCTYSIDVKNTELTVVGDAAGIAHHIYGDMSNSGKFMVDLSKVNSSKGTKVVDVEATYSSTAKKIMKVNPFIDTKKEVSEEEAGLKLKDYNNSNKVTIVAEVTDPGTVSYHGEVNDDISWFSGTANFNTAAVMPKIPTKITEFVERKMR